MAARARAARADRAARAAAAALAAAALLGARGAAAAAPASAVRSPAAALVFEASPPYLEAVQADLVGEAIELVPCLGPDFCRSLSEELCARVVAVVGRPHDVTALSRPCFSQLRLVQSTHYMYARLGDVPPATAVARYAPDWQRDYGAEPIAEFTIAAAFEWLYRLGATSARFGACAWAADAPAGCPTDAELMTHPTLMGQTMGIMGYGVIGRAVARRAAGLGMRVVATKRRGPFEPPPPPLAWLGDDNDRLLAEADFVVVVLPGRLTGIINRTSLGLMKPGAVLIPTSANPVDFDALYEALAGRRIGGAVVDVWPHGCWHFPEQTCGSPYGAPAVPYAGGPIERLDNALVLPGMAMRDAKFWARSASFVAENLRRLLRGLPLEGVVRNGTDANADAVAMWL